MTKLSYDLKQRNKEEHEQDRRNGFFQHGPTQSDLKKETSVHIGGQVEKKEVDEETKQLIEEMNKSKEEPKEDPEITLSDGRVYKWSEINDDVLADETINDDDLIKLSDFYTKYQT